MSRPEPNHYETLGVADGATPEHLKRAYLALVKRWHPDRFAHDPAQQKLAEEKLRAINVAYEALTGEAKVSQSFQHGSAAPAYDPADSAHRQGKAAYAYRERPAGFAVWRGQTGWLSWVGTLMLSLIFLASFWFVVETLAYYYGPPFAADFIRHEAKLQSVLAQTRRAADAGLALRLSVNLSTRDLLDQHLPAKIEALLGDAQSNPQAGSAEIEKMNEAGVSAVVGAFASAICLPYR